MKKQHRPRREKAFARRGRPKGSTRESTLLTTKKRFEIVLSTCLRALFGITEARADDLALMIVAGRPVTVNSVEGHIAKASLTFAGLEDSREYISSLSRRLLDNHQPTKQEIGWLVHSFLALTQALSAKEGNAALWFQMLDELGWSPTLDKIRQSFALPNCDEIRPSKL